MANFITIFRVILAFIVIGLLFVQPVSFGTYMTAFIMTIFVIWMDGIDGYVARKFNECSKFGAVLDILGDRVVENIYWVAFFGLGWIPLWIPLVVLTRGIITDGLRSLAMEKGHTAFGSTTMMETPVGKFLVASNFSRFTYALTKAFAFALLIAAYLPVEYAYKDIVTTTAYVCVYVSVFFCVVRGLPVVIESKRFF